MSIKRYDLWSSGFAPENGEMIQADNGEYMLFDDHKAIYKTGCDMIAELEATIATLTARIAEFEKRSKVCPNCAGSIGEQGHCNECAECEAEKDTDIATLTAENERLKHEAERRGGQLQLLIDDCKKTEAERDRESARADNIQSEWKAHAQRLNAEVMMHAADASNARKERDQLRKELAEAKAVVEKFDYSAAKLAAGFVGDFTRALRKTADDADAQIAAAIAESPLAAKEASHDKR